MAPKKSQKHRLTIERLASYDDILTDALVDHTFYWTTVPKNRQGYHASRGLKEDQITDLIRNHIIAEKDVATAEGKLLETRGLSKFHASLSNDDEKSDFKKHLRRYTNMYLPDCPFEVNSTNRYTITSHEAAISARRFIKKGEQIKYLSGIQVVITPEEEQDIMARKKDFSIVISSRSKCTSLFMGPARFANHDCDANARLVTCGHAGIEVVADRNIEPDEEITVTYSENYFGEENCECLCKTCEDGRVNGWANPDAPDDPDDPKNEESSSPAYSLRRRRRADSTGAASRASSIAPDIRPKITKTKPVKRQSLNPTTRSSTTDSADPEAMLRRKRKRDIDSSLASPPITPPKKQKTGPDSYILPVPTPPAPSDSSRGSSVDSAQKAIFADVVDQTDVVMTDATSSEEEGRDLILHTPDHSPTNPVVPQIKQEGSDMSTVEVSFTTENGRDQPIPSIETPAKPSSDETTEAVEPSVVDHEAEAEAEAEEEVGDTEQDNTLTGSRKRTTPHTEQSASPEPQVRIPGDYTLTPLLLSEPAMAWISCTICTHPFIQPNAYFTRRECPRCERHSKLFGYMWPKTDKAGKNDTEERVMDHRTIHRFLDHGDELRARGKEVAGDASQIPRSEWDMDDLEEAESRKTCVKKSKGSVTKSNGRNRTPGTKQQSKRASQKPTPDQTGARMRARTATGQFVKKSSASQTEEQSGVESDQESERGEEEEEEEVVYIAKTTRSGRAAVRKVL